MIVLAKGRPRGVSPAQPYGRWALQKLGAKRSQTTTAHSEQGRRFRRAPRLPAPGQPAELLAILPHDRCRRPQPDSDAAALVDISALGRNSPYDILGGQYRCHVDATLTRRFASSAIVGVKRFSTASVQISPTSGVLRTLVVSRGTESSKPA